MSYHGIVFQSLAFKKSGLLLTFALLAYVPTTSAQNFSCPQLALSERHTCTVGNCTGQFAISVCNTNEYTSSYQCGQIVPTCCGKPQVAYQTAAETGNCPSCPGAKRRPLLEEKPLLQEEPSVQASLPVKDSSGAACVDASAVNRPPNPVSGKSVAKGQ
jgi:hypothetical protein